MSAKSLKGKMTILTAFYDTVALFKTSLLPVCSGKTVDITGNYSGIDMMPVSNGKCNASCFLVLV